MRLKTFTTGPISQEQLNQFAKAAHDPNPIHLKKEVAQRHGFRTTLVHGMLSMSYVVEAIFYNFPSDQWKLTRIRARFKNIAYCGDRFQIEVEKKKEEKEMILLRCFLKNQEGLLIVEADAELYPH